MSSDSHQAPGDSDPNPGGVRRPRPTTPTPSPPAIRSAGSLSPLPSRAHLHRLSDVWLRNPIYFLTCCTLQRRPLLTLSSASANIIVEAFRDSPRFHRWAIGRYVLMPDHVHFFARPYPDAKPLSDFLRDWKKWTARQLAQLSEVSARVATVSGPVPTEVVIHAAQRNPAPPPVWQYEFFDHLLRSPDSYSEKWDYVRLNPVRAGLVANPEAWPYAGECEPLSF